MSKLKTGYIEAQGWKYMVLLWPLPHNYDNDILIDILCMAQYLLVSEPLTCSTILLIGCIGI